MSIPMYKIVQEAIDAKCQYLEDENYHSECRFLGEFAEKLKELDAHPNSSEKDLQELIEFVVTYQWMG